MRQRNNEWKFDNSMADHDVWLRAEVAEDDPKYYSDICICNNDVMIVSKKK